MNDHFENKYMRQIDILLLASLCAKPSFILQEKPTIESVLYYRAVDANKPNMYVVFRKAYERREWFLELRNKGAYATVRKGRNTNPNRKSAHFIFLGDSKK